MLAHAPGNAQEPKLALELNLALDRAEADARFESVSRKQERRHSLPALPQMQIHAPARKKVRKCAAVQRLEHRSVGEFVRLVQDGRCLREGLTAPFWAERKLRRLAGCPAWNG